MIAIRGSGMAIEAIWGSGVGRAVVVDDDLGEHRRRGPAGADGGELLLGVLDRPLHLLLGLEEGLVDHRSVRLLRLLS